MGAAMRDFQPGKVLVIDDSELVLSVVSDGLISAGWTVTTANSGMNGIEALRADMPEVIVCDLHMEDMTGFEMLGHVSKVDAELPVIILSSDEDLSAVLKAVRRGAFDYVIKSDLGPLLASVERAASMYRMIRDNARLQAKLAEQGDPAIDMSFAAEQARLKTIADEMRSPLSLIQRRTRIAVQQLRQRGLSDLADELDRIRKATDQLALIVDMRLDQT